MWSYLATVGCYLACTYVVVIQAVAGHRTQMEPVHVSLWTNDRA